MSAANASIANPRILLDSVVLPNDGGEAIAKGIRDGTARAVSDGSFNPATPIGPSGTSALNISGSGENWDGLEAVNWVPGTVIDQLAYRSELAGVCVILACLSILVQRFDMRRVASQSTSMESLPSSKQKVIGRCVYPSLVLICSRIFEQESICFILR